MAFCTFSSEKMICAVADQPAMQGDVIRRSIAGPLLVNECMSNFRGIIMLILNPDDVKMSILPDIYFGYGIGQKLLRGEGMVADNK